MCLRWHLPRERRERDCRTGRLVPRVQARAASRSAIELSGADS